MNECKLICSTGEIVAKVGDRYSDHDCEWEIIGFDGNSYLGVTPNVLVRCLGEMPSWYDGYAEQDDEATIYLCGDSVAAMLLTAADAKPRNARGDALIR